MGDESVAELVEDTMYRIDRSAQRSVAFPTRERIVINVWVNLEDIDITVDHAVCDRIDEVKL